MSGQDKELTNLFNFSNQIYFWRWTSWSIWNI